MTGGGGAARPAGLTRRTAEAIGAAGEAAGARGSAAATPVLALVSDLFFVARIRETARVVGVPLTFVRSAEELTGAMAGGARFVLLDLTGRFDFDAVFGALDRVDASQRPAALGFTTHALAKQTQPWHARCARVVTKETLTQELPVLLREGVGR
jgi:hypothetical protein